MTVDINNSGLGKIKMLFGVANDRLNLPSSIDNNRILNAQEISNHY